MNIYKQALKQTTQKTIETTKEVFSVVIIPLTVFFGGVTLITFLVHKYTNNFALAVVLSLLYTTIVLYINSFLENVKKLKESRSL